MRIEIPVCIRTGPRVHLTEDGAFTKDRNGETKWSFQKSKVTGKGIFVAATARAGTVYISEVLQALGYDIGHETDGVDGSVGYHLAVIKPENCFHQVRYPLQQIASMHAHQSWGFMQQVIDIHGIGLRGCMEYWLHWNEMIEKFAVWRYRIESLPDIWPEFLERIGHEYEPLPKISINTNTSKEKGVLERDRFKKITWVDLFNENKEIAQRIKDKAESYGYLQMGKDTVSNPGELERAMVASV